MSSAEIGSGPQEPVTPQEPAKRKFPIMGQKPNLVATREIPENPWIDDVGLLKNRKAHKEVDRLITCNCGSCTSKAKEILAETYKESFNKKIPPMSGETVVVIYARGIQAVRNARREIPPVTVFKK